MPVQSLFPPYPDPVVEETRLMRRSWVGFFQGWIAAWDALLLQVRDLDALVTSLLVERVGLTVDVPYSPSNFTTNVPGGVWAVEVADQVTFQFKLVGDWLTVNVFLLGTSVSGVAAGALQVTIPNGYVAKGGNASTVWAIDNAAVPGGTHYYVPAGSTVIQLSRDDNTNWSASVNATHIGACVSFQIVQP